MKILIIEDDRDISQFIKNGFETAGYIVDSASEGMAGSDLAKANFYDAIILDYSLPGKNGFEICKEIRGRGSSVPIIFLSVTADTERKIEALDIGADDYLTKPFSFDELFARVEALLRRPKTIESSKIKIGDISIDVQKKMAFKEGVALYLTRKEYNLLEYLMRHPGTVVSRSMIMDHVWNSESDPFSNTVEVHILNLRKKVATSDKKDMIRNIPGRGYVLEA